MAEKITIVDGELVLTVTGDSTIVTMSREDVVSKKAEAQTTVDHLTIDLANAQVEVDKWEDYLKEMDK